MAQPRAAFTFSMGQKLLPRAVAAGRLDGRSPALAAGAPNGKVLVHSRAATVVGADATAAAAVAGGAGRVAVGETAAGDLTVLNVGQSVRALAMGNLNPGASRDRSSAGGRDVLLVGTTTHVLAYDVHDNRDLFYRDVPDGVNVICVAALAGLGMTPLAVCGGNCAIHAFDYTGADPFWTVTGDNVTALCALDFDGDGQLELVAGSEDYDVRVFKADEIVAEMSETETVTGLCPVRLEPAGGGQARTDCFAYSLANGTLGVYQGTNRLWRIKSKNHVMSMLTFDLTGDGRLELAVGWSNGKVDFRSPLTGEVLIKESLGSGLAGLSCIDYRLDGKEQLLCVTQDGNVRAYESSAGGGGGPLTADDPLEEIVKEYNNRKQNLLMELANYETNRRVAEGANGDKAAVADHRSIGAIPANTHLQTTLYVNAGGGGPDELPCVELYVRTSNETVIRAVMVFAEGVFPGESHVVHPNLHAASSECRVQLRPEKDVQVDLHVKALVGTKTCAQYHVFELSRTLPRFAMYALCNEQAPAPTGYVTFTVNERAQRLCLWINENFLLQDELTVDDDENLDARFFSLRGAGTLCLQMDANGTVFIRCDDMDLAGQLVTAVAQFFGLADLRTTAEFPTEIDNLVALVQKVNEMYAVRDQLSGDAGDLVNLVKALVVRLEDCRLMDDMLGVKKHAIQLYNMNQELMSQHKVRANNHEELLASLKLINQTIQKAGRLRVGKPRTAVINACRDTIKQGNLDALPKIIRLGAD